MTVPRSIIPCLWFDGQAEEAARFYASVFPDSAVGPVARYGREGFDVHGRPEGSVMTIGFRLMGRDFTALNGGPHFRFTPAISFFVLRDSEAEIDALWAALVEGGRVLMELGAYDWSPRYGWLEDRYGLSWQLGVGRAGEPGPSVLPSLLFVGAQAGRAAEAVRRYTGIFGDSAVEEMVPAGPDEPKGFVAYARFRLGGDGFVAMDSGFAHAFGFNEAVSFQVLCDTQEEIDRHWAALSAGGDPAAQQCGWLKDRFGVSWQVVPSRLPDMMAGPDPQRAARVMKAFLPMKKLDIATIERAYRGEAGGAP